MNPSKGRENGDSESIGSQVWFTETESPADHRRDQRQRSSSDAPSAGLWMAHASTLSRARLHDLTRAARKHLSSLGRHDENHLPSLRRGAGEMPSFGIVIKGDRFE